MEHLEEAGLCPSLWEKDGGTAPCPLRGDTQLLPLQPGSFPSTVVNTNALGIVLGMSTNCRVCLEVWNNCWGLKTPGSGQDCAGAGEDMRDTGTGVWLLSLRDLVSPDVSSSHLVWFWILVSLYPIWFWILDPSPQCDDFWSKDNGGHPLAWNSACDSPCDTMSCRG